MVKILIAEDEQNINAMVKDYLEAIGFEVVQAFDGREALKQFHKESPDVILLDIMMPILDGLEVLREIRQHKMTPVIMITARSEENDRVIGLEMGADDYLVKPFFMKELAARIRSLLRRIQVVEPEQENQIKYKKLEIDLQKHSIKVEGEYCTVTAAQFAIICKFVTNPGRVFSRMDLLQSFQADPYEGYERSIDVHIKNIRKILHDNSSEPEYIETVWGVGYRLKEI